MTNQQQRYPRTILGSCEIPWDEQERFIEPIFRKQVRMTLAHGFNDVYVFGTAGEGYAIDTARFARIVEVFREETTGPGVRAMVGVIGLSTANIVERLKVAYAAGFRAFQISLPSWGPLRDREVMRFFTDVCGAFPDAVFLHYNLPRAKRLLSGRDYRAVADACPNLVATKNTGGGLARASDLMRHAPDLQHFFGEENYPHGYQFGPCSLLSSTAFPFPAKAREIFEAGVRGDTARLFELQFAFHRMFVDVFARFVAEERIDGAYDKMIKRAGGLPEMPLRLLSPYECFSEEAFADFKRVIDEKYAHWRP